MQQMQQVLYSLKALIDWRKQAACQGMDVEQLSIKICWECPVRWECLWVALDEDDHFDPVLGAMWLRGGVVPGIRNRQLYLSQGNTGKAFDRCKEASLKVEDAERKRKIKKGK